MTVSSTSVPALQPPDDPLAYLPCSTILDYPKGVRIYGHDQWSSTLFLVIKGSVKVSRVTRTGRQMIVDIYRSEDLLGEACFMNNSHREEAVTMEDTKVMSWTLPVLTDCIVRNPALALALLKVLAERNQSFKERVESLVTDSTPCRLARALCHFAARLGMPYDNGALRISPFTHELLAQYVGTTREVVTHYMNRFREQGYLKYSRKAIMVQAEALRQWLSEQE